jgi:hypothetical protein
MSFDDPRAEEAASVPSLTSDQVRRLLEFGRASPAIGARFGPYRLVRVLGRGGMGIVFEADQDDVAHRVAVKLMIEGELASEADARKFLSEAERQLHLRHPNIVPVLHVDRAGGRPFFSMPIYRGSLAHAANDAPRDWRSQARLIATIAHAVQHAHERGLLHRDLKPANILLDDAGEPHIADFGLARRMDEIATASGSTLGAGTLPYMAPEQASGSRDLTVAVDIYSLGAMLYERLTGRFPFDEETHAAMLRRIVSDEPVRPPREVEPRVPREIEAICLKCLAKQPSDRYATAADFAQDLEHVLGGRPPSIPPRSAAKRAVYWARRHPTASKRTAATLFVVLALFVAMRSIWQSSVRAQRAELGADASVASGYAGATLFQLRELGDRVQQAALDPAVAKLGTKNAIVLDPPDALKRLAAGFDAVFVLGGSGRILAQWPIPPNYIFGLGYDFRDYFRGARALTETKGQGAYVARAFLSERDGQMKFGVSIPLFEGDGSNGVLVAVVAADSVFGKVRMEDFGGSGRIAALLGPRDIDRDDPRRWPAPERFVVLIHDGLRRGEVVPVPDRPALRAAFQEAAPPGKQFVLRYGVPQTDTDYVDPVRGFEGAWQAAFAPVGGTGYVIAVQTRRRGPLDALRGLARTVRAGL